MSRLLVPNKAHFGGVHNNRKAELLILLYLLERRGFHPMDAHRLAARLPTVKAGYIQARSGLLENWKLIKRHADVSSQMRPCYTYKLAAAGEKYIKETVPIELYEKIRDSIYAKNPELRVIRQIA